MQVIVLGGGFAGIKAIKKLLRKPTKTPIAITLIDKNPYHLFTPSLYEVATKEEPQKNIAIPFTEIFGQKITIVQESVENIDLKKQEVKTQNKLIVYDYLLVALGSNPEYHNVPGLKENSIPLKSLADAVTIKDKIKTMCCKDGECSKKTHVIIGGGGFSGTELAAELLTYKDKLAKQNNLDKDCLQITIIQGSDRLLPELDSHVSTIAKKRISAPNVTFAFGGHIAKVSDKTVFTDNGKAYAYDILIWTGGVAANALGAKSGLPVNKRGQIVVNNYLAANTNVFAVGDIAEFIDPVTQKPAPGVAQVAEEQGSVAGENIARAINKEPLKTYVYRHFGYVVPLKGRFAVAELMFGIHFDGFFGWILQQLVFFYYLWGILSPIKALKNWNIFELELRQ